MLAPSLSSFQETSPLAVVRMRVTWPTADTHPSALCSPPPLRAELESVPTDLGGGGGAPESPHGHVAPFTSPMFWKRC